MATVNCGAVKITIRVWGQYPVGTNRQIKMRGSFFIPHKTRRIALS